MPTDTGRGASNPDNQLESSDPDLIARVGALSGLAFVASQVVSLTWTGSPDYRPTAERAVAMYSDNPASKEVATIVGIFGLPFLLWFSGAVAGAIPTREPGLRGLRYVVVGGGVFTAVALAEAHMFAGAAYFQAARPEGISPSTAILYNDLYTTAAATHLSAGLSAFVGALGVAGARSGILPRPLGWVGAISAIGLLTPIHYVFEAVAVLWIGLVSVVLAGRRGPTG